MPVSFKIVFGNFEKMPMENGKPDVVKVIHYTLVASDGVAERQLPVTITLGEPAPDVPFVPYDQITEEWATKLVESQPNLPSLKDHLEKQLSMSATAPPFASKTDGAAGN